MKRLLELLGTINLFIFSTTNIVACQKNINNNAQNEEIVIPLKENKTILKLNEKENEIQDLNNSLNTIEQEVQILKNNIDIKKQEIEELNNNLSAKIEELQEAKTELQTLQDNSNTKGQEIENLNNIVSAKTEEITNLNTNLNNKEQTIAKLNHEKQTQQQEIEKTKQELQRLTTELQTLQGNSNTKGQEIENLNNIVGAKTEEITNLNTNLNNKEQTIAKLNHEKQTQQQEIEKTKQELQRLTTELQTLQGNSNTKGQELENLNNIVSAKTEEITNLNTNLNNKEQAIEQLNHEKQTQQQEIEKTKQELQRLTTELQTLQGNSNTKSQEIKNLNNIVSAKTEEIANLNTNLNKKEQAIEDSNNIISEKEEEIRNLNDKLEQIKQDLESKTTELHNTENTATTLQEQKRHKGNKRKAQKQRLDEKEKQLKIREEQLDEREAKITIKMDERFKGNIITSFWKDRQKNYFFSTSTSLFVLKLENKQIIEIFTKIDANEIIVHKIDSNNNIYFLKNSINSRTFTEWREIYVLRNNETTPIRINGINENIRNININNDNKVYIESNDGCYTISLKKGTKVTPIKSSDYIKILGFSSNNEIYFNNLNDTGLRGTKANKINNLNGKVNAFFYNQDNNNAYFATNNGAYFLKPNTLQAIKLVSSIEEKINNFLIHDNKVYVQGSFNTYILEYDPINSTHKIEKTLSFDSHCSLYDNNGNIYFGSELGLYKYEIDAEKRPTKIMKTTQDNQSTETNNKINNIYLMNNEIYFSEYTREEENKFYKLDKNNVATSVGKNEIDWWT